MFEAKKNEYLKAKILQELESKIPALPEVIKNLLNVQYYSDVSVSKIAQEIAMDPNLAAEILRFANSNMFFSLRVASLEHAIVVLGVYNVARISLAFWVKRLHESSDLIGYRQRKRDIVLQSFVGAYASKRLADIVDPFLSTSAFTSAAIRLLGRLIIDFYVYSQKTDIIRQIYSGDESYVAEEKILGISFPEATYIITNSWGIPDDIKIPCRYFRCPDNLPDEVSPIIRKLTYILHVGDIIAQMTGAGAAFDNMIERFSRRSFYVLNIDERIIEGIFYETFVRTEKIIEEILPEKIL